MRAARVGLGPRRRFIRGGGSLERGWEKVAAALRRRLASFGVAVGLAARCRSWPWPRSAPTSYGASSPRSSTRKFSGRRWDVPSRIYSAEFLLYPGLDVERAGLARRLARRGYRESDADGGGELAAHSGRHRDLAPAGARGRVRTQKVRIELAGTAIRRITDVESGDELCCRRLEPEELTGIYEGDWKERRVVRVLDVAPLLIRAILVTEDRRFFEHAGVDWVGISRAAWENFRSGEVRQGQHPDPAADEELFLTTDRTLHAQAEGSRDGGRRGAPLLEDADPRELPERDLSRAGGRSRHFGVAEASRFYFGKDPRDLDVARPRPRRPDPGPERYAVPRPERALVRRNTVLRLARDAGEIDEETYELSRAHPPGVVPRAERNQEAAYFVDHVKDELAERSRPSSCVTEGLEIHTTLDPLSRSADDAVRSGLERLEAKHAWLRDRPPRSGSRRRSWRSPHDGRASRRWSGTELRRESAQPRHSRPPPARFDLQADRLSRRAHGPRAGSDITPATSPGRPFTCSTTGRSAGRRATTATTTRRT